MESIEIFKNKYVTKYAHASSLQGKQVLLFDELVKIKSGYYSSLINPCRKAYKDDRKKYGVLKSRLPAITFCGVFNGSHKREKLVSYNNIMVIDIDHISEENIGPLKLKLISDPYILACWVSPSGNGLKLLFRIDSSPIMHKFCFDKILDYLYAQYDIQIDTSGSDVCRLCYVSDDEHLLLKPDAEVFPMQEDEWFISLLTEQSLNSINKITLPIERKQELYTQSEKILFYKTEERNKFSNRDMVKKITTYLKKTNQSITESYSTWLKVALAVANTFTYDIGKEIFLKLCRLDGSSHDEYKSECLLEYCYRKRKPKEINFGSIIYLACQKGFVISPSKQIQN